MHISVCAQLCVHRCVCTGVCGCAGVCLCVCVSCNANVTMTAMLNACWETLHKSVTSCKLCKHVCLINIWVVQDASSVLSKAATLHGMGALPSLAGLKPGQGRGQTVGAVSDSPIAPSSPLIAAKNPFAQVGIVTGL